MIALASCLLSLLAVSPALAQDAGSDPAATADPPAASAAPASAQDDAQPVHAPPSDDEAAVRALLLAARRFQRGDLPLPQPSSLHGSFVVSVRQDDGTKIVADVERWYTRAPQRLLTTATESVTGGRTTVCWNDGQAWFRDEKSGDVVVYTDAPDVHEVDLELLAQQLELTQLLLDAAVLDSLVPRLVGAHMSGTRTIVDPDDEVHQVSLVTARVSDPLYAQALGAATPEQGQAPLALELEFAIEPDTGALWELRVRCPGRADLAPMRLVFAFHGHSRSGLRVPGNIKVFRADETLERIRLGVVEDEEGYLVFDVDTPIDAARFALSVPR